MWLNFQFRRLLPRDVLDALVGKKVAIAVSDAGSRFVFEWTGNRFHACAGEEKTDLAFKATAYDFLQMALRREDPDTLFFCRRLVIEGDTELGLLLKNTLDALEWSLAMPILPNLPAVLRRPGGLPKK